MLKPKLIFQTMQEIHEALSTAGAVPSNLAELGTHVQTSGRGDNTVVLTVACLFKFEAGENWDDFCELYTPTKKLDNKFIKTTSGKLRGFWKRLENKGIYWQAESVAVARLRQLK